MTSERITPGDDEARHPGSPKPRSWVVAGARSIVAVSAGVVVLALVVRLLHDASFSAVGCDPVKFLALSWPGLRLLFMHFWWWAGAAAGGFAVGLFIERRPTLHGALAGAVALGLVLCEILGSRPHSRLLDLGTWAAPWYASEAKSAFAALLFAPPIAASAGSAVRRGLAPGKSLASSVLALVVGGGASGGAFLGAIVLGGCCLESSLTGSFVLGAAWAGALLGGLFIGLLARERPLLHGVVVGGVATLLLASDLAIGVRRLAAVPALLVGTPLAALAGGMLRARLVTGRWNVRRDP